MPSLGVQEARTAPAQTLTLSYSRPTFCKVKPSVPLLASHEQLSPAQAIEVKSTDALSIAPPLQALQQLNANQQSPMRRACSPETEQRKMSNQPETLDGVGRNQTDQAFSGPETRIKRPASQASVDDYFELSTDAATQSINLLSEDWTFTQGWVAQLQKEHFQHFLQEWRRKEENVEGDDTSSGEPSPARPSKHQKSQKSQSAASGGGIQRASKRTSDGSVDGDGEDNAPRRRVKRPAKPTWQVDQELRCIELAARRNVTAKCLKSSYPSVSRLKFVSPTSTIVSVLINSHHISRVDNSRII